MFHVAIAVIVMVPMLALMADAIAAVAMAIEDSVTFPAAFTTDHHHLAAGGKGFHDGLLFFQDRLLHDGFFFHDRFFDHLLLDHGLFDDLLFHDGLLHHFPLNHRLLHDFLFHDRLFDDHSLLHD